MSKGPSAAGARALFHRRSRSRQTAKEAEWAYALAVARGCHRAECILDAHNAQGNTSAVAIRLQRVPTPDANSDLYVFENSRIPGEYKIGKSTEVRQRARGLQRSQSFYIHSVASFEGKVHLEQEVRHMLAHCLLPREVAPGREWHACSLQTALGAIGQAIDSEKALQ